MDSEEKLISDNLDIPRICSRKWGRMMSLEMEDLQAEGSLALVRAARSYDPSRGKSFRNWAYLKVMGHVTDIVRSHIRREKRTLTGDYARYSSLQTVDDEGELIYQLEDPNADVVDLVVAKEHLNALKHIPKREAEVILRMACGETAVEIAEMWNCSEALIWRLMRMGRKRMEYAQDQ